MLATPRAQAGSYEESRSWPPGRVLCWSPSLWWAKLQCPLVTGPGDRPDPSRWACPGGDVVLVGWSLHFVHCHPPEPLS